MKPPVGRLLQTDRMISEQGPMAGVQSDHLSDSSKSKYCSRESVDMAEGKLTSAQPLRVEERRKARTKGEAKLPKDYGTIDCVPATPFLDGA